MAFIQNPPGKIKESPEFRVLAYPRSQIGHIETTDGDVCFNDNIRALMLQSAGTALMPEYIPPGGTQSFNRNGIHVTNNPYTNQQKFKSIDARLQYVELGESVSVGADGAQPPQLADGGTLAGFTLSPISLPLNSIIEEDLRSTGTGEEGYYGTAPNGAAHLPLHWQPTAPKADEGGPTWEMLLPFSYEKNSAIRCTRPLPNQTATATAKSPLLAKDRSLSFVLNWEGVVPRHTAGAAYRISWGNDAWSIRWSYGDVPVVCKGKGRNWLPWYRLDGMAKSTFTGEDRVRIRLIAQRLVIEINNQSWVISNTRAVVGKYNQRAAVTWPAGDLRVNAFGVKAILRAGIILYADPETSHEILARAGNEIQNATNRAEIDRIVRRVSSEIRSAGSSEGVFQREFHHNPNYGEPLRTTDFEVFASGDQSQGTEVKLEIQQTDKPQFLQYQCTLVSDPACIYTPLVTGVMGRHKGEFDKESGAPLDLSNAFLNGTETSGEPGVMPGASWSLTFDARLLEELPNWKEYLREFHPITFEVRWRYTDGSYSDWVGRLHGYIGGPSASAPGANRGEVTIEAHDPIWRLTKPNAIIDHRYMPLVFLFVANGGKKLYGADCIHDIVRVALGQEIADRINGGTVGDQLYRYMVPGHYPLISDDGAGYFPLSNPASHNDAIMPPPFGSAPIDWMHTIAGYDFHDFYYGFPTEVGEDGSIAHGTDWPVLMYGWYPALIANRPTWNIPDAIYDDATDFNQVLLDAQSSVMTEWSINRVLAWGGAGEEKTIWPSFAMAEARLEPNDPNAAEWTWERTTVVRNELLNTLSGSDLAGPVMAQAYMYLRMFANKRMQRSALSFVGEERMGWGDKIQTKMQKDGTDADYSPDHLQVGGVEFRVVKLNNRYDTTKAGTEQFTTKAQCAPFNKEYEG